MNINRFIILIILASFWSMSLAACTGQDQGSKRKPVSAVSAKTYQVTESQLPEMMSFPGRTEAKVQVLLASKVPGFVRAIKVQEGDPVKKGELVLSVDDTDIKTRIQALTAEKEGIASRQAAVNADFIYAKDNFKRYESLKKDDAATQEEFDRARSRFEALKNQLESFNADLRRIDANVKEAENQLSYVSLVSPVNGWVTEKTVDTGSYINPGVTLLRIDSSENGFWFEADIDEGLLSKITPDATARLSIPSANIDEQVKISQIVPYVSPSTHTFAIKVDMKEPDLKSGLYGKILIPSGKLKCLVIPEKDLVKRGGMTGVYTVGKDRIVHWRIVKTGRKWIYERSSWLPAGSGYDQSGGRPEFVEILSGINSKDTVVTSNLDMVQEGVRLE